MLETLLRLIKGRKGEYGAIKTVDKYQHAVQSAFLASVNYPIEFPENLRSEFIVAALFHDAFGGVCPEEHARMAAATLYPFVSNVVYYVVATHENMMLSYYENTRENGLKYRRTAANFNEFKYMRWFADEVDVKAFDKSLTNLSPLAYTEHFEAVFK